MNTHSIDDSRFGNQNVGKDARAFGYQIRAVGFALLGKSALLGYCHSNQSTAAVCPHALSPSVSLTDLSRAVVVVTSGAK